MSSVTTAWFDELPSSTKRELVLATLEDLKDTHPTYDELWHRLSNNPAVPDEYISSIYHSIANVWQAMQQMTDAHKHDLLTKSQQYLQQLQEWEAQQRQQEEQEAENMINNI